LAACALGALLFCAWMRLALGRANPVRVLEGVRGSDARSRLEALVARAERLAQSAAILALACGLAVVLCLVWAFQDQPQRLWWSAAIALPLLILFGQALPAALAVRLGDALLTRCLWSFSILQWPIGFLAWAFDRLQLALLRVAGRNSDPAGARAIVEDLREVVEEAEVTGQLDETEKEIIGNVIEAREVTVAAIMTPRTEVQAVEIGTGLLGAAKLSAEFGHSRVPVYEDTLDRIVGTLAARDLLSAILEDAARPVRLADLLRPALFVPETKRVADLLEEFKREKQKLAIVLDEYGGTAGMVTLGDVVAHLVGEMRDEDEESSAPRIRQLPDGTSEVDASLRVSEVNERLELNIPEDEHYETLAGFVLSELGHFPRQGDRWDWEGVEFQIVEATERRIVRLRLRAKQLAPSSAKES
jgi:putative hemolysin